MKKNTQILKKIIFSGDIELSVLKNKDNKIIIHRLAPRGKISNYIENYEFIDANKESSLKPLTLDIANQILERIESGQAYSSAFIFYSKEIIFEESKDKEKSKEEHQYTSTGVKFWRHRPQMVSYKKGTGRSVVSTHISPEGACNLKCPYCSVTYRDTHSRLELDTIKDYVEKLQTRGLKAVILTGGGEPTAYKYFNELVQWIKYERGLSVALITNGTLAKRLDKETLKAFSWLRVSINLFNNWEHRIGNNLDINDLSDDCIVGCSMVYTVEHESTKEIMTNRIETLNKVSKIADRLNAKYIRLLPNCLLEQKHLVVQHESLSNILRKVNDDRFFQQYKVHGQPKSGVCHQAYFRPYLSEEPFGDTGVSGTVYPCDSVVLNDSYQHFAKEYQLCRPEDILKFLDREILPQFDPRDRCKGCVFTSNVDMLDDYKNGKINKFLEYSKRMTHEEFI